MITFPIRHFHGKLATTGKKKCSFDVCHRRCAELILEHQFNYQNALRFRQELCPTCQNVITYIMMTYSCSGVKGGSGSTESKYGDKKVKYWSMNLVMNLVI